MSDSDIDTGDIPELTDAFFERAELRTPQGRSSVFLSVDKDVLEWFQNHGSEFHRLVNNALREYAESHS